MRSSNFSVLVRSLCIWHIEGYSIGKKNSSFKHYKDETGHTVRGHSELKENSSGRDCWQLEKVLKKNAVLADLLILLKEKSIFKKIKVLLNMNNWLNMYNFFFFKFLKSNMQAKQIRLQTRFGTNGLQCLQGNLEAGCFTLYCHEALKVIKVSCESSWPLTSWSLSRVGLYGACVN